MQKKEIDGAGPHSSAESQHIPDVVSAQALCTTCRNSIDSSIISAFRPQHLLICLAFGRGEPLKIKKQKNTYSCVAFPSPVKRKIMPLLYFQSSI